MKNLNIQWITSDEGLFEYDWLQEILPDVKIHIVRELNEAKINKNTLVICNPVVNYREVLEKIRQNSKKYGILLLSDENIIEPCEWLHDPACLFLVRNYINPWIYGHPKVTTIGLGYKREFKNDLVSKVSSKRKYTWSFAGTPHKERKSMLQLFEPIGTSKVHFCSGFGATDGLSTTEYSKLLNNSIFALCPPGQDSMDSFRFYEALEAGCIPITLNRTAHLPIVPSYWHGIFNKQKNLPIITGESWEVCIDIVKSILQKNTVNTLQEECRVFWEQYKKECAKELNSLLNKLNIT